jgi:SAM-dependent methyltransferase
MKKETESLQIGHREQDHGHHHHERHGAKQPERFDPGKAALLDDPERFSYLPPAKILSLLNPPQNGIVVDFGTGTGTYAFELAKLRPDLNITALDEQEEMLARVKEKLEKNSNLKIYPLLVKTGALPKLDADRILALNVLHELGDEALQDIKQIIKSDGKILFVDWSSEIDRPVGPPRDHVYSIKEAAGRVKQFGFSIQKEERLQYHYALVCLAKP